MKKKQGFKKIFLPASAFGKIQKPDYLVKYKDEPESLFLFLNIIIKIMIMGAGLFTLFNLIMAGYGFIAAGGNSEAVEKAWAKIWQSLIGIVIVAGSFIIAGVIGQVIFGQPGALITPKLYTP